MREGWEIRKLGDLADLQRGLTYSKGDEVPYSSKRVLRSNNIDLESSKLDLTDLKYLREDFAIPEDRKVKKNSIFICMSNGSKQHVGKVAFIDADIDYAFGGFMGLIVPKAGITPKYVFYSCQSSAYRLFLSSIGNGIGITNLRFTDLANYSIPAPPISKQEKIVAELDCLTDIIDKKKQQLEELDKLAQSIFYDMFGDPITNEKGWKQLRLEELITMGVITYHLDGNHGAFYPRSEEFVEKGVPYIGANCIEDGLANLCLAKHLSIERAETLRKGIAKDKDVLFAHNATVGPVALLRTEEERVILSTSLTAFRCNQSKMAPFFLRAYMCSEWFVPQYKTIMKQSTRNQIPISQQRKMYFILPPLDLQNEFAKKIDAIEKEKELVKRSIVETETLFNSRIDYWFS